MAISVRCWKTCSSYSLLPHFPALVEMACPTGARLHPHPSSAQGSVLTQQAILSILWQLFPGSRQQAEIRAGA